MEDELINSAESSLPVLSPAPRNDLIGELAHRLCADPPDFTAAPPLVEAIRERQGDIAADEIAGRIIGLSRQIPPDAAEIEDVWLLLRLARRLRNNLNRICIPYLYDLTSTSTAMARFIALTTKPVATLETAQIELEAVRMRVPQGYGVGDRIRMHDGRSGIVVTPRGVDGRAGVIPAENNYPQDGASANDQATKADPDM